MSSAAQQLQGVDVSYLTDAALLFRHFEYRGEIRQAISVLKRRTGPHERTIRELRLKPPVHVGDPLREFRGVLTSAPEYLGANAELLER
jgi:circadian clock protein KaiC